MTGFLLQGFKRRGVGPAFVDRDLLRPTMLPHRLLEKTERSFLITMGSEEKVDRLAVPINGAVEVCPLAFDFDVSLIHPPARADRAFLPFPERRFQLRGKLLNPAVHTGIIDFNPLLRQHLFQVPITQWVSSVPADTGQDEVFLEAMAFEVNQGGLGLFVGYLA